MTVATADPWVACWEYLVTQCGVAARARDVETNRRYALVLWMFAECIDAKTILEIGVGPESVSGCTFLHSLAQRAGRLISIDIDDHLPQQAYRDLASRLGVLWTVLHGDSLTITVPFVPASVDLLYIDGNHDAEHAEGDLVKYLPLLRPGGYLLIDDFPPQKGEGEGRAAIDAIVPHTIHVAHQPPHGNGRLVWQTPL